MAAVARPPPRRRPAGRYDNGKRRPKPTKNLKKKGAKKLKGRRAGKKTSKKSKKSKKKRGSRRSLRFVRAEYDGFDSWGHLHHYRHDRVHERHTIDNRDSRDKDTADDADDARFQAVSGSGAVDPRMEYANGQRNPRYRPPRRRRPLMYDAPDPARGHRVHIEHGFGGSSVRMLPRDNRPIRPRTQFVKPFKVFRPKDGARGYADNYPIDATLEQDPLAVKMSDEQLGSYLIDPYMPPGSLNPVKPYINNPEPRTTTFSTVPDMLQQQAQAQVVVMG